MSNIWFVSDLHFGHNNIINYCKRPYATVEEMDQALVNNWNDVVCAADTVYCLGDMAFHNYERISQLRGKKLLVPGNHDHERMKRIAPYIQEVMDEVVYLEIDKFRRFVLCHYPFESWRREYQFHLHGHAHGGSVARFNRLDVGVDATKLYRPLNLDELGDHMNQWVEK